VSAHTRTAFPLKLLPQAFVRGAPDPAADTDRSHHDQPDGQSAIYPQVSLGFSNETVTWPLPL
jgi:hypothetical protein